MRWWRGRRWYRARKDPFEDESFELGVPEEGWPEEEPEDEWEAFYTPRPRTIELDTGQETQLPPDDGPSLRDAGYIELAEVVEREDPRIVTRDGGLAYEDDEP